MDKACLCDMVKEHEAKIVEICHKYDDNPGSLITILNDVQEDFGFLPIQVQEIISRETNIPLSEIYGVTTFYSRFSLTPSGKHKVGVCLGTACYVKGSQSVLDAFKRDLNIDVGETTADGQFSLEATRCVGACGLAPVVTVDGEVFGTSKTDDVPKIIQKYLEGDEA